MVTYKTGDIFKSPAQVITNTINCVGVMGAGLALEFKNRYAHSCNCQKWLQIFCVPVPSIFNFENGATWEFEF